MAVTTNTQTEQIHTMQAPGTKAPTFDEQSLRNELKEASQQFFNTLFRVGVRLTLTPVSLLPKEPQEHFVSAAREFADNVDKIVEEVETNLKKDI